MSAPPPHTHTQNNGSSDCSSPQKNIYQSFEMLDPSTKTSFVFSFLKKIMIS